MTLTHALLFFFSFSLLPFNTYSFALVTEPSKLCMTLEIKVLSTSEINLNRIGDTLMVTV